MLNTGFISINRDQVIFIKTEVDYSTREIEAFIYLTGDKCLKDKFDFSDLDQIDADSSEYNIHKAVIYYYNY
jgi:hypothetical protein